MVFIWANGFKKALSSGKVDGKKIPLDFLYTFDILFTVNRQ